MNLGLTGVCNGTDLTSTFTPTPHHEESWGTGKPGVKIGPGASRGQPARSLGASLSLSPLFIGPRSQGFSSSLFAIGRGLAFFPPPQSFSSSPLPLPCPSDRSAPPAPSSSGREEFRKKSFPEVWIRARTGRPREEEGEGGEKGRGRRERE